MTRAEADSLRAYAAKLRSYTTDELRDIYGHIHILRHPVRYKLLLRELEARGVSQENVVPAAPRSEVLDWLDGFRVLARHGGLKALAAGMTLLTVCAVITFGLLLPIWLFIGPFDFRGIQTAIVYLLYAPVGPWVGLMVGVRLGGRGSYFLWVLAGVVLALWSFYLTGAPADLWRSITEHEGSSGFNIGGF